MSDKQQKAFSENGENVRRIWVELDGQNLADVLANKRRLRSATFRAGAAQ